MAWAINQANNQAINQKGSRNVIAICVAAVSALAGVSAQAEGSADKKIDTVVFWGTDYARNNKNTYDVGVGAGLITSLEGDMSATGLALSGYIGYATTTTPAATTDSVSGWASLSHIWQFPNGYLSFGAGFAFDDSDGVASFLQYGFEVTASNSLFVQSYGSHSGNDDAIFALGRFGYATSSNRLGVEVTFMDDSTSRETWRYGAFVSGIDITPTVSMTVSAGFQDEYQPGVDDGAYVALGFSVPLSLR